MVVRTRIFCLVHGSSETRCDRGAQPGDARLWKAPRLSFLIIRSVSVTLLQISLRNLETEQTKR